VFVKQNQSKNKLITYILCTVVSFFYIPVYAAQTTANKTNVNTTNKSQQTSKNLDKVHQEISTQKKNIAITNKKRKNLENQLKNDELAIAKAAKAVNHTTNELVQSKNKIKQLTQQKKQLLKQKAQQQNLLAQQLRAAYSSGNHDYLKLILNQQKPASVQRTLSYYQYFNQARIDEITKFETTVKQLTKVTLEQQQQSKTLAQLKQQQIGQKQLLSRSSETRKNTLKKLSKQLLTNKQKLNKLQFEEENLSIELSRLEKLARQEQNKKTLNLSGLDALKHKLNWPVNGRLLKRFGNRKQGSLKWKGVLINAPVGKEIKSIHNGKVLFSDWLNGYGLVIVIDHGNGYMSLYGHNQALLKNVGDRVETGEPLALVGQSGGQSRSGLYFEIRQQGKAVNPKIWCQ
jgi:septal ring factor EnvC (AmiA/AmiB activator)